MVSLPDEEESDAIETIKIVRELSKYCTNITASATKILPGSELEIMAKAKGLLPENFTWYNKFFNHSYTDLGPPWLPLYIEKLSIIFIREFIREINQIRLSNYSSLWEFTRLLLHGIKRIHRNSLNTNIGKVKLALGVMKEKLF
jgi:hypothetical protein